MKHHKPLMAAPMLLAMTLFACIQVGPPEVDSGNTADRNASQAPGQVQVAIAAPLSASIDAVEVARTEPLPDVPPEEYDGLHNVFRLGDKIISGGEPLNLAAFDTLEEMGVKTILSVDGKAPNWQAAAERGMRYVHVPIEYGGIEDETLGQIAKTFREAQGPFFVHCFHGKHRGPAAAAVGRIVLDGIPRERALAEMLQWCGTATKYHGLFEEIAFADVPDAETTQAITFDFPRERKFEGIRATMIPMARHWDEVKYSIKRDWQPDPEHPDVVPAQEALKLAQLFGQCETMPDYKNEMPKSDQVLDWFEQGKRGTQDLARILGQQQELEAQGVDWREQALAAYRVAAQSCKSCHVQYRD